MDWVVLLPVKSPGAAKSRLAPDWPDPADLADLVTAMRRDTLHAVRATPSVTGVVAAVDREDAVRGLGAGLDVVVQTGTGLNAALADADRFARSRWPGAARIAVVGDLPALTPDAFGAVLATAARHPRAYVPDSEGTGTTMLAVTDGALDPRFGPGSARAHARDAVALPAAPEARHDVDVAHDLRPPPEVGFGPETRAVLARRDRVGCPRG